jgi:carbonic anhydrase
MAIQHDHKPVPQDIKPMEALHILKKGNFRFINNLKVNRDLLEQVNDTQDGQWPFAAILSCMDSRTSAELIFDQGLGDVFSIRIAGNVVTEGILGSLEYATAVAGSKLIVVLGHTKCGAIKGACDNVKMGNLTSLIERIQPAVKKEHTVTEDRTSNNNEFVNAVAILNVMHSVEEIMSKSEIIKKLVDEGKVGIVPALYDVMTGKVAFYEDDAIVNIPEASRKAKVA